MPKFVEFTDYYGIQTSVNIDRITHVQDKKEYTEIYFTAKSTKESTPHHVSTKESYASVMAKLKA